MGKIICFFLLFILGNFAYAADTQQKFMTVADIHFDPFIGCESKKPCQLIHDLNAASYQNWENILNQHEAQVSVQHYQDTTYHLLKMTFNELKQVNDAQHPQFVLILGDFIGHKFRKKYREFSEEKSNASYQVFVKKTFQFLAQEAQKVFPTTNIYSVIGNNDSYTGNYHVIPNGAFLQDIESIWAPLIKDKNNRSGFQSTFSAGGYYEITLSDKNKILVLNTVLFSERTHGNGMRAMALAQINWLHQKLILAQQQHKHVILAFHIPDGIDIFATFKNKLNVTPFWKVEYSQRVEQEVKQFSDVITAILPAHIHKETFKFLTIKDLSGIPIYFTPSISPIFGNDPGFKLFTYDVNTLKIEKVNTYTYSLGATNPGWV